ncbi:Anaphase-promoting complex subunit 5 [Coemansia biformis]|uniref:Anaphase-promoting complex subunit 5 n=1 Tax=Coemansia biformis TaxID=1286918 RepID=A0A9W8CYU6_9FUNG|nr:Anaphase-promoting complex subunit 5 [Coemansia biformis]
MSHNGYLSAAKAVLLVAVEQYARHYDWGPGPRAELAQFLAERLCAPSWTPDWPRLRAELERIQVPGEGGRTVRAVLADRLAEQLQTVDGLHGFFDGVGRLVVDAEARMETDAEAVLLDSESILGVYVRRCCLAFDQLEFHQVGQLFAECQQAAAAIGDGGPRPADRAPRRSRLELQEHIEHLIDLLESEAGAPVAGALEAQLRQAADQLPDHSRLHYLSYLSLVRAGESEQSEAALRRFFDSTRDSRGTHQYALLYLAAMRAQLGMDAGARQALAEATHVARDCQDHVCLLFIVCWESRLQLARLKSAAAATTTAANAQPVRAARATIGALIEKAATMRCYELQTVGYLQLVDLLLAVNADPREVFESLLQAQALATEHNALRALMCCEDELCGARQCRSVDVQFVHPSTADDLADADEWLGMRDECLGRPTHVKRPAGDVHAGRLREARELIDGGYLCEARDVLLAIAHRLDGTQPPALATEIARDMLTQMESSVPHPA